MKKKEEIGIKKASSFFFQFAENYCFFPFFALPSSYAHPILPVHVERVIHSSAK